MEGWNYWSGKRDSNPRPSAWKADALATELFPLRIDSYLKKFSLGRLAARREEWRGKDSNLRRHSRQIYSLLPLAAREPLRTKLAILARKPLTVKRFPGLLSWRGPAPIKPWHWATPRNSREAPSGRSDVGRDDQVNRACRFFRRPDCSVS